MSIFFFLILLTAIILETSIFPFSLSFIAFSLLMQTRADDVSLFAFLGGILLDLFSLRLLGGSSLFFLLFVLILRRYGLKFYQGRLLFQFLFILAGMYISQLLFYPGVNWNVFIVISFCTGIILLTIKRMFPDTLPTKKKLAL